MTGMRDQMCLRTVPHSGRGCYSQEVGGALRSKIAQVFGGWKSQRTERGLGGIDPTKERE